MFRHVALYNVPDNFAEQIRAPIRPHPKSGLSTIAATHQAVQIEDLRTQPPYLEGDPTVVAMSDLAGARTLVVVPMLRENELIGAIAIYRQEVRTFSDKQIVLLQTFADQAVIAIGNVHLFEEVQAKTRDLTESLEQQTATSEVLQVISSSPGELQPVFKSMLTNALRICDAKFGNLLLFNGEGFTLAEMHNAPAAYGELYKNGPLRPGPHTGLGRLMATKQVVHIADVQAASDAHGDPLRVATTQILQARSFLAVPMLKDKELVGAIVIYRQEVRPFSAKEIELVSSFASQAVIAIENTRLLKELRERTDDLSESLQQQTATADVLKVISRSAFDLDTVMNTLTRSASELCAADMSGLFLREGDFLVARGVSNIDEKLADMVRTTPVRIDDQTYMGRSVLTGEITNLSDVDSEPLNTRFLAFQKAFGYRSLMVVPLMREGRGVGVFALCSVRAGAFSQRQIDLVQTFADQAVIAIENVRLFNETQEALERQTATADILKVIASSPSDVQPVFDAIATSSKQLIGAFSATVFRFVDGVVNLVAYTPIGPEADAVLTASFPRPAAGLPFFELAKGGKVVQEADSETNPDTAMRDIARARGFRSSLFSPLMNKGIPIGLIVVTRKEPGTFAEHHVQLLQTFADQAVIAIENVRLFDEVQAQTRDLTEALTYQTGSSNILSVIASSPTDVAPVLKAIVESACELCEAYDAVVLLKDGDDLRFSAHHGPLGINLEKWPISRNWTAGRAFVDRKPVHVRDLLSDEGAQFPDSKELSRHTGSQGMRSILSVPLLRENESIGTILLRRTEVQPFSDKQIALLQTFADQAVIAIGNVRLFDEVQAKTRDLTEALTYQTGSSNILRVIASSPTDVGPVLKAIVESACELCEADDALATLRDGDDLLFMAQHGSIPVSVAADADQPPVAFGPRRCRSQAGPCA